MSGTFPTSPAPASITPRSLQPTLVSTGHSLHRQARSKGAQRFGFSLTWKAVKRADINAIIAFMLAQQGQYETFTFVPPVIGTRSASGTSAVTVQTTTASGRSVPVTGAGAGEQIGLAGDFVKFAGHNKAYMLTADATADGSGDASLSIEPALFSSVAATEAVTLDDVPFTVASTSDKIQAPVSPGIIFDLSIDLVEVP